MHFISRRVHISVQTRIRTICSCLAALAIGAGRSVTVVDHGDFMAGIALAAGIAVASEDPKPVWADALPYLKAATAMGLVMAED